MELAEEAGQYLECEGEQLAKNTRTLKLIRFIAAGLAKRLDPTIDVPPVVYPWQRTDISRRNNGGE